jgi:hypothetical protein
MLGRDALGERNHVETRDDEPVDQNKWNAIAGSRRCAASAVKLPTVYQRPAAFETRHGTDTEIAE